MNVYPNTPEQPDTQDAPKAESFNIILNGLPFSIALMPAVFILADNGIIPESWSPYYYLIIAGSLLVGGCGVSLRFFLYAWRVYKRETDPTKNQQQQQYLVILIVNMLLFLAGAIWALAVGPERFM